MRIVLCGDFVPTDETIPAFEAGNLSILMGATTEIIRSADYAVANLECALTDRGTPIRKLGPNLKGKSEYARVIARAGFTHLGLSNNHTWDYGEAGFRDTVSTIKSAGMIPFGYGENDQDSRKPLFLEKDGIRLALIAVCEHEYSYALPDQIGANPFDPFDTMEDIAAAKARADWVVVMYHGGKEQCPYPSPRLRKACRAMVRAGAALVLCQHSHCIGCRETYDGAQILYGQGNFNFVGESDLPSSQNGLMLEAAFARDRIDLTYWPVTTKADGITLAEGEEKERILSDFDKRSETLVDDKAWIAEWEAFCRTMPYYADAVRHAYTDVPCGEICNQVFPHYLDCEAHLDVWKTIYKTWHAAQTDDMTPKE